MIKVLFKIPFFKFYHWLGWPRVMPLNYTINASFKCNSRCITCNAWKMENHDMSLDEWKKIFQSLGKSPYWFTFSGGEPFLREDLAELIKASYDICQPKIINIPTNSLLGAEFITAKVKEICEACPKADVVLNLSLDGIDKMHDQIRGREGNFEKVIENYKALKKMECKNLSVGIHSVVSKANFHHIKELYNYVEKELDPDQYITEIAEERKELETDGMPITPNYKEYSEAIDFLLVKLKERQVKKIGKLTKGFRIDYYQMVKEWLTRREQVLPCYAGVASAQISPEGEIWPCCVRADDLGDLKKNDYVFKKVWFGKEANRIRKSIKNNECSCPLANAAYSTMLCNFKTLAKVGINYLFKNEK